jgi:hypothetical protein
MAGALAATHAVVAAARNLGGCCMAYLMAEAPVQVQKTSSRSCSACESRGGDSPTPSTWFLNPTILLLSKEALRISASKGLICLSTFPSN